MRRNKIMYKSKKMLKQNQNVEEVIEEKSKSRNDPLFVLVGVLLYLREKFIKEK